MCRPARSATCRSSGWPTSVDRLRYAELTMRPLRGGAWIPRRRSRAT
jgi:hypothetical protein